MGRPIYQSVCIPKTFNKFSELPAELRIQIWEAAMPGPRTVAISSPYSRPESEDSSQTIPDKCSKADRTWRSNTKIPVLLHVNQEARYEALKHYRLAFGMAHLGPRIYVDFSRDTVFFGYEEIRQDCRRLWADCPDLKLIRRLAIVPQGAWRVFRWESISIEQLETLFFVHGTETIELGSLPQLQEDTEDTAEAKERARQAAEEIDTMLMILPDTPERQPRHTTAVFMNSG